MDLQLVEQHVIKQRDLRFAPINDAAFKAKNLSHVIFCLKYRRKVLTDTEATCMKESVLAKQADYRYTRGV